MQYFILVLFICLIPFLYALYFFAKEDFVIVRKDIQMEKIFNLAFLTFFSSIFFARLFFALQYPSDAILNPIGFLALTYVPGLSFIGGLIGGSIFLYLYCNFRKMPKGKLFDLFILSFLSVMPLGFLGSIVLLGGKTNTFFNILFVVSMLLLFILNKFAYRFSIRGEIKDGTLGLIFVAVFSFVYFLLKMIIFTKTFLFSDYENILLLATTFFAVIIILNQEIIDKVIYKK